MSERHKAQPASLKADVAIIGGGLSGLAAADSLHRHGMRVQVFEARNRFGGRIDVLRTKGGAVDLGPSWFWPGQTRIADLIDELGLQAFPQYADGQSTFEDPAGAVQRGVGFASMEGSFRLEGGMQGLIDGLLTRLPNDCLHLQSAVAGVDLNGTVTLADGRTCAAGHVILALPPRLAATLTFTPALPEPVLSALKAIPTWMAGHAKLVAVYDMPFWRDAHLSGDAVSRRGPLREIHDASGMNEVPSALFGFLGLSAPQRARRASAIIDAALQQLGRLFGPKATNPKDVILRDWATQPETATMSDYVPPRWHPVFGLPEPLTALDLERLHFAGTESDPEAGGLMEGALAAAERVTRSILEAQSRC